MTWLPGFALGLQLDPLSWIWTIIITGVGFLIHLYSNGYLAGDRTVARFFAYLNFSPSRCSRWCSRTTSSGCSSVGGWWVWPPIS